MKELRCDGHLHGKLDGSFLEIKCRSRICGARPGVAVFHLFHAESGVLLKTYKKVEGNSPT